MREITYVCNYQDEDTTTPHVNNTLKVIAFHLPQFYAIPENDRWWGTGFTEWTNTRKSYPRLSGHYQPREPHPDIGYYDLSDYKVLNQQAELARRHGIFGFCFYYYWFSGKQLLEKPIEMLLEHPEIDINFCLCWANENWTRVWSDVEDELLMAQRYSDSDCEPFIHSLEKFFLDKRYIKIDGRPLILVYRTKKIPNCDLTFKKWRQIWQDKHNQDLEIWVCESLPGTDYSPALIAQIDAFVEFPPNTDGYAAYDHWTKVCNGWVYDYKTTVEEIVNGCERISHTTGRERHRCVMMGWDNTPRRVENFRIWNNFSLKLFYAWSLFIANWTIKKFPPSRRIMFVNAWNEWCEGTYLEPDKKYGYANINTLGRAIAAANENLAAAERIENAKS